jgi:uncharacterized phiE125 gp8 family phage protein
MHYTRTPGTTAPFDLTAIKSHMRVSGSDEDAEITAMGKTAGIEIEAYCALALLNQTITATSEQWPGQDVRLPVGPVAADTVPTVAIIEQDGTTTAIASGFWLEVGRYPVLHFTSTPGARLRITYQAGYGATVDAIPADIQHALSDVAARLYDMRGVETGAATFPPAAARILARYRQVRA